MRGAALPLLAWAAFLALLAIINAIWAHSAIQTATFGFAVLVVAGGGVALAATNRTALRRGPPEASEEEPEPVPDVSYGAMLAGLAVGAILYGIAFAAALSYVGFGLLVLALGRLAVEVRSTRRTVREAEAHVRRTGAPT